MHKECVSMCDELYPEEQVFPQVVLSEKLRGDRASQTKILTGEVGKNSR